MLMPVHQTNSTIRKVSVALSKQVPFSLRTMTSCSESPLLDEAFGASSRSIVVAADLAAFRSANSVPTLSRVN